MGRQTGYRETPTGFQAWITVHGRTTFQRFPKGTTIREIREWQALTKSEQLTTSSPFAPKPTGRRGRFDADARRYLAAVKAMPTYRQRKQHIEEWIAVFGDRRRSSITSADIAAYLNTLRATGMAASSVNKRRTALQHLFSVLDGKAATNPVRDVPKFQEPTPRPRGVDYATIEKVLAKLPKGKHYARALVFAYVGIPHALLKRIQESDVDWEGKAVLVPERRKGKGMPARVVPLTDLGVRAFRAMQRYDAWGSFSRWRMGKMWKAAQLDAGVTEHIRVYDLRHSFLSAAYLASGDLYAVQELAGHSSATLTARYTMTAVQPRLQAAVAQMNAYGRAGKDIGKPSPVSSDPKSIKVDQQTSQKPA